MRKDSKKNLVYVLILLIPFLIFFTKSELGQAVRFKLAHVFSSPLRILSFPFQEIKKILYYHRTFEAYRYYKKKSGALNAKLVAFDEVLQENARLQKLLDFKKSLVYSSVVANVIGRNPSHWNSSMIIDRGRKDRIAVDMPVVNAFGVVGKIVEVSDSTSKVILLTDPQFSVAGLVQRPRESVLVSGTLRGVLKLRYIDENAKIELGDKIITSKLSGSFPENMMIGEVVEIIPNEHSALSEYVVRPAVPLSQLEEVLVIVK